MEKYNEILKNDLFIKYIYELENLEKNRIFCKHGIEHCLDVARIAYIKVLENNLSFSKDIIYAAALLHDLGRVIEYKQNIPHDKAGIDIANRILDKTSYDNKEKIQIINAISGHRTSSNNNENKCCLGGYIEENISEMSLFTKLIKTSDKMSRSCFNCKSKDKCNWDDYKKNFVIKY